MQDSIKNMMDEFMKNASSFKGFDLPQNTDMLNNLSNSKVGIQLLDFQKSAFNNSYNTIVKIQAQSEKIADSFLKENSTIPAEGKKMLTEWKAAFKKGQTEFKKSVDDSFNKAESYLAEAKKETKDK